uniref:Uncharacterized protein n=1 Tax=Rhodosorus marinus TaxID=101924 RepID=A0A7S0BLV2_9RHOD|mmetsp:Transcript_22488/g.32382  ORF Transcript_22488/g.32382 Transcript_22488/m.32382 type:complete len:500 (+) Transcript_22488:407-1906(+)
MLGFCGVLTLERRGNSGFPRVLRGSNRARRTCSRAGARKLADDEEKYVSTSSTNESDQDNADAGNHPEDERDEMLRGDITEEEVRDMIRFFPPSAFMPLDYFVEKDSAVFTGTSRSEPSEALAVIERIFSSKFKDNYVVCLSESDSSEANSLSIIVVRSRAEKRETQRVPTSLLLGAFSFYFVASSLTILEPRASDLRLFPGAVTVLSIFSVLSVSIVFQRLLAAKLGLKLGQAFIMPIGRPFSLPVHFSRISIPGGSRYSRFLIGLAGAPLLAVAGCMMFQLGVQLTSMSGPLWRVQSTTLTNSWLMSAMAMRLGKNLPMSSDRKIIGLHPLAVVASFLIRMAAIHLLPFTPFDGSRLLKSSLSKRGAKLVSKVYMCVLALACGIYPSMLTFLILRVFAKWPEDSPPRNELERVPIWTTLASYVLLWYVVFSLTPLPRNYNVFEGDRVVLQFREFVSRMILSPFGSLASLNSGAEKISGVPGYFDHETVLLMPETGGL